MYKYLFKINLEKKSGSKAEEKHSSQFPACLLLSKNPILALNLYILQRRIKACQVAGSLGDKLVLPDTYICHFGEGRSLPPPLSSSSVFLTTFSSLSEGTLEKTLFSRDLVKYQGHVSAPYGFKSLVIAQLPIPEFGFGN